MSVDQVGWLEKLHQSPDLARLIAHAHEFNLFEAVGMVRQEIRHSHFLATLFDRGKAHGFGGQVFEAVFKKILQQSEDVNSELSRQDFEGADYSDLSVLRERWNIDLLLVSESNQHVFVIENKIDANEHGDQLERYSQRIDKEYPVAQGYKKVFVYLTPGGDAPSSDRWLSTTHTMIVEQLEMLLKKQGAQIPAAAKMATEHYIQLIRRHIMGNSDIEKLCREIYRQHSEALDLIYEHKPNRLSEAMTYVKEFIQERGVDDGFVWDSVEKKLCRFFAESWLRHPLQQSGDWGKNNCVLMFEFIIRQKANIDAICLNLYIGPGDQGFRQQLFNVFQPDSGFRKPQGVREVKTKLTDQYTAVLQFGEFIQLKEDVDESEFKSELEQKFRRFCQHDWPDIQKALAPIMESSK